MSYDDQTLNPADVYLFYLGKMFFESKKDIRNKHGHFKNKIGSSFFLENAENVVVKSN